MRILLAIDDSKCSEVATEAVIEQARPQDTEVRVLQVVEPRSFWSPVRGAMILPSKPLGRLRTSEERQL
jgi:Universal stress protein family